MQRNARIQVEKANVLYLSDVDPRAVNLALLALSSLLLGFCAIILKVMLGNAFHASTTNIPRHLTRRPRPGR